MSLIVHSSSPYNKSIDVIKFFWKKELRVNGIQQSGPYTIRLWKRGLADIHHNHVKSILVLGVGGGTLFPMLRKKYPDAVITAVDIDKEIINIYKKYFSENSEVELICRDAREFVRQEKRKFDLIIVDLYIANDVPEFVTGKPFISALKNRVAPRGIVLFNYFSFSGQSEKSAVFFNRLSTIYQRVTRKRILRNVFYYCGKIG